MRYQVRCHHSQRLRLVASKSETCFDNNPTGRHHPVKQKMNFPALIGQQRKFFQSGATAPLEFRRAQLMALQNLLIEHESEWLDALRADLGKSPQDAYVSEIGFVLGEIRHALKHLAVWTRPERRRTPLLAWPASSEMRREPFGVALIIGPWNYPLQLLLSPLVGAIAAGNCAILKPSEFAPHTAAVVDRLIRSAFPEEYLATVEGGRETSEALLAECFDAIFFTGSTATGRAVMTAAARHLTPVILELGGKCPCIVAHDAPVELTARRIAWGKFMNAGQTCVAPDHVWVDRRVAPALLAALQKTLRNFYGDDPRTSADYSRIINRRHLDRLTNYLGDGTIAHGGAVEPTELYLAPTILTEPSKASPVMSEEIFGPILPILEFTDLDDVLADLRERPSPLAVYGFTASRELQDRLLAGTRSGGVCFNDTILQILGHDLPFGGVGASGMGRYHGRASFDCFSHQRVVLRRSLAVDLPFRYPPIKTSLAALRRLLRFTG
jgi:acyl-CoA reductase-like NAD-dependent aldehyde dehydrogenase